MRSNFISTVTHLTSSTSLTRPALLSVLAAGAVLVPHSSYALDNGALPLGETVIGGGATFDRSTTNALYVNQSTNRLVVNWNSFNIGSDAMTQFHQPSSGSLAVNRVVGKNSDPTQILGSLKANGRIMVLDRNGVLFGANSRVDVGGIVASTGDVSTKAVMRGDNTLVLKNLGSAGQVINNGLINITDGGLAAFVAPTVRNNGVISAKLGKVVLAAGIDTATVDLYGDGLVQLAMNDKTSAVLADNGGIINTEGGTVLMTASAAKNVVDSVVNMSGVINASSAKMVGGKIILSGGQGGTVKVSGSLNASGKTGGKIEIKGKAVELTNTSFVSANGGALNGTGNGGQVDVFGNQNTIFRGRIEAEGGALGGNGGYVEVSTGSDLIFTGTVSTLAPNGLAGRLIIDPTDLTIHDGFLTWLFGSENYLSADLLAILLAGNGTVTVEATNTVNVGTNTNGFGIGTGNVDVSSYWVSGHSCGWFCWTPGYFKTTKGNLNLKAATVNFVKNLTVGKGSVSVDATTLNLDSKIYGKNYSHTVLLGDSRLNSSNALSVINVLSDDAKIQQAISFANNGVRINVDSGTYHESVLVNKSVDLFGDNAMIAPHSPGFDVTANDVTINGFEIYGADTGILVNNANYATIKNNTIHSGHTGIRLNNSYGAIVSCNTVDDQTGNGIEAFGGDNLLISHNSVTNSGQNGIALYDIGSFYGEGLVSPSFAPGYDPFYNAEVIGNHVSWSGENGIASYNVPHILIKSNNVSHSGYHGSSYPSSIGFNKKSYKDFGRGGDGIHVETYGNVLEYGTDTLVDVLNNTVTDSKDDGIDVSYMHSDRFSDARPQPIEYIYDEYDPYTGHAINLNILGNSVFDSGDDGVRVTLQGDQRLTIHPDNAIQSDFLPEIYDPVIHISVLIDNNTVDNPVFFEEWADLKSALFYDQEYPSCNLKGDGIEVNSYFSPWSNVMTDTIISNNIVSNSGQNGVYISGPSHDFVALSGNVLNDNPVGANFESGEIDLTGVTNTINGGDIGLFFNPYLLGYDYGDVNYIRASLFVEPKPIYAQMSLHKNTIGTTVFDGQGTYYVELANGAFFDPGHPTLLNGLKATYDGLKPSSTNGVLTQMQRNHLETMFYHFRDDNSLGLFFFGAVPGSLGTFSQEDIFRLFGTFSPNTPSGGLTITGLPFIGGGSPQSFGGAQAFANISPAAGNEEDDSYANIEPSAGENADIVPCWNDAGNILGQGTPVSFSFGIEGGKLLDQMAACGTQSF
ncbi:MAG TPA: filamentous hemagglutinin N-terminal domain-containing protein [Alphaproteobacteria bacterium]|nr:filamentous hemagglutinin N-terminal domain-containing protein [Alphaproteobacteria bacterium]